MAIRLRKIGGRIVALCAAETDPEAGDFYLGDAIHEALARKFAREHTVDWCDEQANALMDSQKKRDAVEEHDKWQRSQPNE